jgi:hypothetical protein
MERLNVSNHVQADKNRNSDIQKALKVGKKIEEVSDISRYWRFMWIEIY